MPFGFRKMKDESPADNQNQENLIVARVGGLKRLGLGRARLQKVGVGTEDNVYGQVTRTSRACVGGPKRRRNKPESAGASCAGLGEMTLQIAKKGDTHIYDG